MNKTIENKLFTEFETGAAALCLDYIMEVVINNWEHLPPNSSKWRKVYNDMPARVVELTNAFDEIAWPLNIKGQYRIAQELSDNLDKCINDNDIERYICSILQVFEEWAKVFTPISQIQTGEYTLKKVREGLAFQTEKEIRTAIDRIKGMHDRLLVIMENSKEGSIEAYFRHWYHAYYDFCNMLAAICTEHGINLLEIQNRRGIWLVDKLDVMQIQLYFGYNGNYNYANSLLKSLPRTSATEHLILTMRDGVINTEAAWNGNDDKWTLPIALNSDRAIKYFSRAAENKLIELTKNEGKCLTTVAKLGYLCGKIYPMPRPISALEKFFKVYNLSAAITQSEYEAKRADVKRWRQEIDDIIFYD